MKITNWLRQTFAQDSQVSRPVLFDHLPKCAGTAFSHYLRRNFSKRETFRLDGYSPLKSVGEFRELLPERRQRYRLVTGHLAHDLLDLVHPQTVNVTVLREPVDRIVSHYFYVKRRTDHHLHDAVVKGKISLERYAESGISAELTNWYTSHFTGLTAQQIDRDPTAALRTALEVITARYHVVGFQDDLEGAAEMLRMEAGLPITMKPRQRNVTQRPAKQSQLTEQVRASIAGANQVDIALYKRLKALSVTSASGTRPGSLLNAA